MYSKMKKGPAASVSVMKNKQKKSYSEESKIKINGRSEFFVTRITVHGLLKKKKRRLKGRFFSFCLFCCASRCVERIVLLSKPFANKRKLLEKKWLNMFLT